MFLFCPLFIIGQEICDNDADDDGDGLIDYNDTECSCIVTTNTSIISNHSFEDYTQCPDYPSQMLFVNSWQHFHNATSDYFNCNYAFLGISEAGLDNYPHGTGIVGSIITPDYREYPATILNQPMNANTTYQLTLSIAALSIDDIGHYLDNTRIYPPLDLTVYGTSMAPNFIYQGDGAPSQSSADWFVIGSATYTPASKWQEITIIFTPYVDIVAITFGAPENLSASYNIMFEPISFPYFLYDNLVLKEASEFGINITSTGNFCNGNLVLTGNLLVPFNNPQYQWFLDGVAMAGATGISLSIPNSPMASGNYTVRVSNNTGCYMSTSYTTESFLTVPMTTVVQPTCLITGTITVTTSAFQYSFDDGITWQNSNVSPPLPQGTYQVRIRTQSGCISGPRSVSIIPSLSYGPQFSIDPVTCESAGTITVQTIAPEYSFDNGATWTTANTATNLNPGIYYIRVKNTAGCISSSVAATLDPPIVPDPSYTVSNPFCDALTGSISIDIVQGALYSFDGGSTYQNSNVSNNLPHGQYQIKYQNNICESAIVNVTITSSLGTPSAPAGSLQQQFCISNNPTVANLVAVGQNISWYTTIGASNPLPPSTPILNGQTYYATQTINNCEGDNFLVVNVTLINASLAVNNYVDYFCESNYPSTVDISQYNDQLADLSEPLIFTYFMDQASADDNLAAGQINNYNSFPLALGTTSLYVRAEASSGCYAIAELKLTVYPDVEPMLDNNYVICENGSLTISAAAGFDIYEWSNGKSTPTITLFEPGNYSLSVTNIHNGISCTTTQAFVVNVSPAPIISEVIAIDWTNHHNSITVVLDNIGEGSFEYSIDGMTFQESNFFNGLAPGEYIVYVRDLNECSVLEHKIFLLSYPNFFTPNGDGQNDLWHIRFSRNEPNLKIKIFDRYGKLITSLDPQKPGWDGTLNGKQLPSTDYWFLVTRENGHQHSGHFSMKR